MFNFNIFILFKKIHIIISNHCKYQYNHSNTCVALKYFKLWRKNIKRKMDRLAQTHINFALSNLNRILAHLVVLACMHDVRIYKLERHDGEWRSLVFVVAYASEDRLASVCEWDQTRCRSSEWKGALDLWTDVNEIGLFNSINCLLNDNRFTALHAVFLFYFSLTDRFIKKVYSERRSVSRLHGRN